jgi:hypothetical protein
LKEGSNDSEKDEILNLTDDVCNMVRGINISAVATPTVVVKEKKKNVLRFKLGKKKGIMELGYNYYHGRIKWLTTCQTSDSTSINKNRKGCSIPEVMTELHSIEGVNIGDDFHGFATEFLGLRRNREMWSTMGNLENKMKWLQRMYTRHKAP